MTTLGEKRVGINFNTTNNDLVNQIKVKTAELINLIQGLRNNEVVAVPNESEEDFRQRVREKLRVISIAQTKFEDACMWAVRANFK